MQIGNIYPASHDVPDGGRWSVCLDGSLTGVREGNLVTSMKKSRAAEVESADSVCSMVHADRCRYSNRLITNIS